MTQEQPNGVQGGMSDQHEPTQEEIDAYARAWEAKRREIGRGIADLGTKTRAGLTAANALRDRRVQHAVNRIVAAEIRALANHVMYVTDADEIINAMRTRAAMLNDSHPISVADEDHCLSTRTHEQHYWGTDGHVHHCKGYIAVEDLPPEETTKEQSPELDPRPWVITHGSIGTSAGTHFAHSGNIPSSARFRFQPGPEFEQDPGRYPEHLYGRMPQPTQQATPIERTGNVTFDQRLRHLSLIESAAAVAGIDMSQSIEWLRTSLKIDHERAAKTKPVSLKDITDEEIYKERQHQISSGYSARHDDEHGIRHLLLHAIQYGKRGKAIQSLALIRAALESMARQGKDL